MKKIIIFVILTFTCTFTINALEQTKPATHNTSWEKLHGQASKVNEQECLSCHTERIECIACHEDIAPRNHSIAWVQKNHGLESRWNRMNCNVCHREDFCSECHEEAVPLNHSRAGFATFGKPTFHCNTGCQLPVGTWRNTTARNCVVCHKTRPLLKTGDLHGMN